MDQYLHEKNIHLYKHMWWLCENWSADVIFRMEVFIFHMWCVIKALWFYQKPNLVRVCTLVLLYTYMIGIALEWILHLRKYDTKSWDFTCCITEISNFGDNHISTHSLYIALNWQLLEVFSFLFKNIVILLNHFQVRN